MRVPKSAAFALSLWATGCAGADYSLARTPAPPAYVGDARGQASLETLPSLDVDEGEITGEMRVARLLSAESLTLAPPDKPAETTATAIQEWSDSVFKGWLASKQRRAEAARAQLDRAAVQSHRQRIMAGAMVGLVYEDLARVLIAVPVPDDIKAEPEIAEMFADVIASQCMPYLMQAKRAYEACAKNAIAPATMNHWSVYCQQRADQLPRVGKAEKEPERTEVSVVSP